MFSTFVTKMESSDHPCHWFICLYGDAIECMNDTLFVFQILDVALRCLCASTKQQHVEG